ncbi:hypothetical protein ACFFX0_11845 [Citricoccus parietis]|uniref:Uncharacterized protein n=1 Tax=Citricoccus parietis TaxID=592307 RepID=A0ABV5FYT6_9MICC
MGPHPGLLPVRQPAGGATAGDDGQLLQVIHRTFAAGTGLEPGHRLGLVERRGQVGPGQQRGDLPGQGRPAEEDDLLDPAGQRMGVLPQPAGGTEEPRVGADGVVAEAGVRARLGEQWQAEGVREGGRQGSGAVTGHHHGA